MKSVIVHFNPVDEEHIESIPGFLAACHYPLSRVPEQYELGCKYFEGFTMRFFADIEVRELYSIRKPE
jgi:hypothetical protein